MQKEVGHRRGNDRDAVTDEGRGQGARAGHAEVVQQGDREGSPPPRSAVKVKAATLALAVELAATVPVVARRLRLRGSPEPLGSQRHEPGTISLKCSHGTHPRRDAAEASWSGRRWGRC